MSNIESINSNFSIRGSLNSIIDPSFNLDMLSGFVIANYFDYVTQAKLLLILPIVFVMLFARIPESPQYLMSIQKLKVRASSVI